MITQREIVVETLSDLLTGGYGISWYCGNDKCGRTLPLSLEQAIELFGADFQFVDQKLPVRCAECGSRKINKSLTAPGTGGGLFRTR